MAEDRPEREALITRRQFVACQLGALGALAAGVCGCVGAKESERPRRMVPLGDPHKLSQGTTLFRLERVAVLRRGDTLRALSLLCTHMECIVDQRESGFECSCHGARFGPEGEILRGPAVTPLRFFPLSLSPSGALQVDLALPVSADRIFELKG